MRLRRVGGEREIPVKLRIVAATNRNIAEAVASGTFREDLYHRISVFSIAVPPLRDRREDISELAANFATFFSRRIKGRDATLSATALGKLAAYDYPGNVRELRNIVERAVILARTAEIAPDDIVLPRTDSAHPAAAEGFFSVALAPGQEPPAVDVVERAYVHRMLDHCGGRRMLAAEKLGLSYPTFLRKLREMGLDE